MSLIEEALRKHREEQAAPKPGLSTNSGAASTSANPPVLPETREPSRRRLLLLLGFAILLTVVVVAAIFSGSLKLLKRVGPPQSEPPIRSGIGVSPGGPTTMIAIATATATKSTLSSNTVAPATNRQPVVLSDTLANGPVTGITVVAAAASTSQPLAQVTVMGTVTNPILPVNPPPRPVWPRLSVSGIMQAPGNRSTAIVNGKPLRQGETVHGATITAVNRQGVTFEFEGETRRIRTGNSSD